MFEDFLQLFAPVPAMEQTPTSARSAMGSIPTTPRELADSVQKPARRKSLTIETVQKAMEAQNKRRATSEPPREA
eukprot:5785314-Amphidinium_carterae.1